MFKRKVLAIINPLCQSKFSCRDKLALLFDTYLNPVNFNYEIEVTQYKGHAKLLAQQAVDSDYDIVIVAGGDGTVNEVAFALMGKDILLVILPVGKKNDISKGLVLPPKPEKVISSINGLKSYKIDICRNGTQIALHQAGLGLDGYKAFSWNVEQEKARRTAAQYPSFEYVLEVNDKKVEGEGLWVSLFNSRSPYDLSTEAGVGNYQDGTMDVVVMKLPPKIKSMIAKSRFMRGNLKSSKYLQVYKAEEVKISTNIPVHTQVDGNPLDEKSEFEMRIIPKSLNILVP